ncbi:PAS domain S-box-containing protein/diguanylate cyclase (GGDEF) domain-containing protein [Paucidesulfovibrio gracilis DSM 16080]|uniref:PAS domain S-box-containing protein/diguanylate cyclase (GGDEF) domain-containing protein n=1 Tax=Paucidesulfovibrio gracilis DSM 16080 TaxID=1121449 RepID=A0A1T4WUH5_9BACT|nr:EAL domain-containing protein [Paucidesulfovibrio gracilis]SKA81013.1 PAS domain S-box-containing protein/diguanylate cyclase (GGDEF) domain-containing protein [Paucidesulfovibrio gracilis DSM 16080]
MPSEAGETTYDKAKILIVDDDRVNLKVLEGMLRGLDAEIHLALSGEEALELAMQHHFVLVLLDVMMPGIDGFQTAEQLRSRGGTEDIPIIFVTAISKEQRHVFKGYELGAVDYLFKPVEPEILQSKVRVFLDLYAQRQALQASEERYRTVADYNYDWEIWFSPNDKILYCSPSCERISGYTADEIIDGEDIFRRIILDEDYDSWRHFMADEMRVDGDSFDFRIFRKDGRERWISLVKFDVRKDDGKSLGLRCSLRDITDRKKMEIQLRHQALHDPLTALANRTLLMDRVARAMERANRHEDFHFALVFLDLDRFKVVNDSLGHIFGDSLLVEVSKRLWECVRGMDTVARFGGDEFVLLLEELDAPREAFTVIRRVLDQLREPFLIEGHQVQTTVSIGVVLGAQEDDRPSDLLQKANIAMYRAKESGRDRFDIYNDRMLQRAVDLMHLENDLRKAVQEREFRVYYQPIVSLEHGGLAGFEALVRWEHPERGIVSPGEFIPLAEETGLIIDLGRQVLEESTRTLARWGREHEQAEKLQLSVNISARQFRNNDLVQDVITALQKSGLQPGRLKLEITESTVMDNVETSLLRLQRLKEEGIRISMDDFGTGYSSMSYLQKFPLDQLKVDLSFVRRILDSTENAEIVRAIITLAHSLRMAVVAEGIELEEQADLLHSLHCELGQGYLYSPPVPAKQAEELLLKGIPAARPR